MDDSCASDNYEHTNTSVTSILGIKGGLRFQAHGSTQKAHLVLRRVIVSDNSDDDISGCKLVRFALIAHKRIEVKPGKELLLMLESENGPFKDRPVVFEGDLRSSGDTSDIEDDAHGRDEEVVVPPVQVVMPPKLRKAWSRKVEDGITVTTPQEKPRATLTSIGIQTEPSQVQLTREFKDTAIQTSVMAKSLSVQVDSPSSRVLHLGSTFMAPSQTESPSVKSTNFTNCGGTFSAQMSDKRERSLSPMELDSPPESPRCLPLPLGSPPAPELDPVSSPIYSPTLSIASSSGAQDMQLSPIDLKLPAKYDTMVSAAPERISTSGQGISSKSLAVGTSSTDISATSKPQACGKKSTVTNPFVSGGFLTSFGASPEKPNGRIKTEVEDPKLSTSSNPEAHAQSFSTPAKTTQSEKESAVRTPCIVEDTTTSSTSVQLTNVANQSTSTLDDVAVENLPAKPMLGTTSLPPMNGMLSNPLGIRPSSILSTPKKLPVTSSASAKKRLVAGSEWRPSRAAANLGPAVDTPSSAPVTSGATTSASILSHITSYSSSSPSSTVPPALPTSVSPNKWKPVSATISTSDPTTTLPSDSKALRPPSQTTDVKPSVSNTSCSAPPARALSPESSRRLQKSPLSEKTLAGSLEGRLTPSSASASATPKPSCSLRDRLEQPPTAPTAPTASGSGSLKDRLAPLRTTYSNDSLLSRMSQTTPPISEITSPSSTLVSRSPALPPTPSQSSSTKPLSPTISRSKPSVTSERKSSIASKPISPVSSKSSIPTPPMHPLPMKPSTSAVAIKRERSHSSEPGSRKRQKRAFKWPTIGSNYTANLAGEGPVGIRNIAFCSDGTLFALSCDDRTVRIWNSQNRTEVARLSHNTPIVAVVWMDGDSGVLSLCEDGIVSKWTRSGVNHWKWAKALEAGKGEQRTEGDQICLAYMGDRIAVSYPRSGVKVWIWTKGQWQGQRPILRQNVTAITFIDGGAAILGGTRDGVVWHSEIPNGTLRAYTFLSSRVQTLDVNPSTSHVLVGLGSSAFLVGIRPDNKGTVEKSFTCKEIETRQDRPGGFGAVFATGGQAVLFGHVDDCLLVWDRKSASMVYGMEHGEDDTIQAVASFTAPNQEGFLVTGTKSGKLLWWSQPVGAV